MSCSRCGYALTPQNQVCPRCGQPVGAPPPDPPTYPPQGAPVPPPQGSYPPPGYPPPGAYPPPSGYPPQGAYGVPPGYGAPGYYAPRYPTNVSGSLILVFGILSIALSLFCGLFGLFGIAAILMGNNAVAAIDRGEADPSQRGPANAGRICGIFGTVFLALSVIGMIVLFAIPDFRKGLSGGFDKGYSQSQHGTTPSDSTPGDSSSGGDTTTTTSPSTSP